MLAGRDIRGPPSPRATRSPRTGTLKRSDFHECQNLNRLKDRLSSHLSSYWCAPRLSVVSANFGTGETLVSLGFGLLRVNATCQASHVLALLLVSVLQLSRSASEACLDRTGPRYNHVGFLDTSLSLCLSLRPGPC